MQITAKFASTCNSCSKSIVVGSRVEWVPGTKARHVSCVGGAATVVSWPRASRRRVCGYPGCTGGLSHCDECSE